MNCIENISNEIIYEIFDYMDGFDMHQAFTNLNNRFENLIRFSSRYAASPGISNPRTPVSNRTRCMPNEDNHYLLFIR